MTDTFDTRGEFEDSWLFEMPEGTPPSDYSRTVENNIRDVISFTKRLGHKIEDLGNNLRKIELTNSVYYWYEVDKQILLGIELSKKGQTVIVNLIGKYNKGKAPFASDLYDAVLKDRKKINPGNDNICIMSDKFLSEEGLRIWVRLLQQGHKIMVYNSDAPGQSQIRITSVEELQQFFKMNDPAGQKFRYVISESTSYADLIAVFNIRRIRELHKIL
jgi:hypothetical protein